MTEINIGLFELQVTAQTNLFLPPFKGSTLRGGFGHVFKSLVCSCPEKCHESCFLKEKCPYGYIFETPVPVDSQRMRKYPYAPHPFVIEPTLDKKRNYSINDELSFRLMLIGKSIGYLPYFIYTFEELGKIGIGKEKGKYQLMTVNNITQSNQVIPIYTGTDRIVRNTYQPILFSLPAYEPVEASLPTHNSKITLYFLTPARLKFEGVLGTNIWRFRFLVLCHELIG